MLASVSWTKRNAMRPLVSGCALLAAMLSGADALAEPQARRPTPFDHLGDNIVDSFSGTNLLLHTAAIATTAALSASGEDYQIRVNTARHAQVKAYGDAALYSGYILPFVLGPSLYVAGLAAHEQDLTAAGAATMQAAALAAAASGVLKWATGRPYPNHGLDPHDPERLREPGYAKEFSFQPTNFDRGFAWPSGHTTTAVAMAAALSSYYREHLWVAFVGYPAAIGIGVGMISGEHHWASDVVAGALIGHVIGYTVGNSYRPSHTARTRRDGAQPWVQLAPMSGGCCGISAQGAF